MVLKSVNPTTGEILKKFKEWKLEEIRKQVSKISNTFDSWKETDYSDSTKMLKKLLRFFAITIKNMPHE